MTLNLNNENMTLKAARPCRLLLATAYYIDMGTLLGNIVLLAAAAPLQLPGYV